MNRKGKIIVDYSVKKKSVKRKFGSDRHDAQQPETNSATSSASVLEDLWKMKSTDGRKKRKREREGGKGERERERERE